jgi:biotin transport system substrate-specific component
MASVNLGTISLLRYNAFRWRFELSLSQKMILTAGMSILTGLLAQVIIPLPWTPIPITGQTFAFLLAGVLLGGRWGAVSQIIYAGLGAAGLPWFTGWQGGLGHLVGPTGGYVIGFILAALCVGYLTDKFVGARGFFPLVIIMLIANFSLVYIPGLIQLGLWLDLVKGQSVSLIQTLNMGLFPFLVGDVIKVLAAAGAAWVILPKQSFDLKK